MRFQNNEEITNYVNLFVSVIICFPEITTIKYDRDREKLYFNFILKGGKTEAEIAAALHKMKEAYQSYCRMEGKNLAEFSVNCISAGDYTVLEAKRDMKTVTRSEIAFLVELMKSRFGDALVVEAIDPDEEDYRWLHREADEAETDRKRIKFDEKSIGNNILVCREAGKVLVFSNS